MADSPITEFIFVNLKPGAQVDEAGSPADLALQEVASDIKQVSGVTRILFGRQIENPSVGVLIVAWSTIAASSAFAASPALPSIKTKIASPLLSSGSSPPPPHRTVLSPPDAVGAALAAPTVEVFTGYGAEAGFEDNVRDFSAKVDAEKPTGYHAAAVGPVADPVARGEAQGDADKGLAVKLVIGWDSKEAHLEAKGKSGAVRDHIDLLRTLRKEVDLWHANLKEY